MQTQEQMRLLTPFTRVSVNVYVDGNAMPSHEAGTVAEYDATTNYVLVIFDHDRVENARTCLRLGVRSTRALWVRDWLLINPLIDEQTKYWNDMQFYDEKTHAERIARDGNDKENDEFLKYIDKEIENNEYCARFQLEYLTKLKYARKVKDAYLIALENKQKR